MREFISQIFRLVLLFKYSAKRFGLDHPQKLKNIFESLQKLPKIRAIWTEYYGQFVFKNVPNPRLNLIFYQTTECLVKWEEKSCRDLATVEKIVRLLYVVQVNQCSVRICIVTEIFWKIWEYSLFYPEYCFSQTAKKIVFGAGLASIFYIVTSDNETTWRLIHAKMRTKFTLMSYNKFYR